MTLDALEVKPSIIKSIKESVKQEAMKVDSISSGKVSGVGSGFKSLANTLQVQAVKGHGRYYSTSDCQIATSELDDVSLLTQVSLVTTTTTATATVAATDIGSSSMDRRRSLSVGARRTSNDPSVISSTSTFSNASVISVSSPMPRPVGTTSPASFSTISSHASNYSSGEAASRTTVAAAAHNSSAIKISTNSVSNSKHDSGISNFHPASYLSFLDIPKFSSLSQKDLPGDGKSIKAMSNEAEMTLFFQATAAALQPGEDWQARMSALESLQMLAWCYSRDHLQPSLQCADGWKMPLVDVSFLVQNLKEIREQV